MEDLRSGGTTAASLQILAITEDVAPAKVSGVELMAGMGSLKPEFPEMENDGRSGQHMYRPAKQLEISGWQY